VLSRDQLLDAAAGSNYASLGASGDFEGFVELLLGTRLAGERTAK
jgi:hypothetical protein